MTDEWVQTTLGDLADWHGGLTPSMKNRVFWEGGNIPWISPKEVHGGVLTRTQKSVTGEALKRTGLRLVPPGSVVIVVRSGILLHTLPVAYVPFATTVNQDVKVGTPGKGVDGRFLAYLIESMEQDVLSSYRKTGTTVQSINVPALLAHSVSLPPLPVQRRIVDLMEHLDAHLANLDDELVRARSIRDAWLDSWLRGRQPSDERLGRVCTFRSGPSWRAQDERRDPGPDARRVLKITNTQPSGRIDLTEETYVSGLPATTRTISDTSIVMIRTNGNRSRIGNVYLPTSEMEGFAVSAFQFLGQAESPEARDFIYWLLSAPSNQSLMSAQASGSTGLGNLASGWLREFPIPESTQDERSQFVATARSLSSLLTALEQECRELGGVRRQVLGSLLRHHLELPDSYDAIMGVCDVWV